MPGRRYQVAAIMQRPGPPYDLAERTANTAAGSTCYRDHSVTRVRVVSRKLAFVRVRFGFVSFSPDIGKPAEFLGFSLERAKGFEPLDPDLGKV